MQSKMLARVSCPGGRVDAGNHWRADCMPAVPRVRDRTFEMTCFALLLGPDGLDFRFQTKLLFTGAIDTGIPFYIVGLLERFGSRYHIGYVGKTCVAPELNAVKFLGEYTKIQCNSSRG